MELFNYSSDHIEPRKGDLLISEPFLNDPNFSRTVVLLCEHNDEGSFGFVINKPADIKLNELMSDVGNREDDVFVGGPVQQNALQFIHKCSGLVEGSAEVMDGVFWGGDFQQMVAMLEGDLIQEEDIKFFIGYSGWGAGQLNKELEINSWIISRNVKSEQIFNTDVDSLWKEVLNTMGGKFKIVANFPVDPRLN